MECEVCPENGPGCVTTRKEASGLQTFMHRKRNISRCALRLDFPTGIFGEASDRQMYLSVAPHDRPAQQNANNVSNEAPFMNNMDEISYWIYTKRAPCLMNYDNLMKKQKEEAHCSKAKPKSVPITIQETPSPKKKKKRKLLSLSDASVSDDKQKNIYFGTSQNHRTAISSGSMGSDIDFNIKQSSVRRKHKRPKMQKTSKTTINIKNKVITSKATALRRSLRQKQRSVNNGHMSLTFKTNLLNGTNIKNNIDSDNNITHESHDMLASRDQHCDKVATVDANDKANIRNGKFEDLSDMSGFTANYIMSTKVQSKKTQRKLRCKTSKNLIKESKHNEKKDDTTATSVNKSNTKPSKNLLINCSTDSSLIVANDNSKTDKLNKNTSVMKLLDKSKNSASVNDKEKDNNDTVIESTSRYPRRIKNLKANNVEPVNSRNISKNSSEFDNSDRKENPPDKLTRTRSGRNIGLTLRQPENSVLVVSNSTEQVSSSVSLNMASPKLKKKRVSKKSLHPPKNRERGRVSSVRDKSGFSACFTDSDDSQPLQRKFFCA